MKRALAVAGLLALGAFVVLTALAIRDPLLRRDLAQAPGEAATWVRTKARGLARSSELAARPDLIEPKRYRWNAWASTYDLTVYRYVQSDPWITDGASLTFRFPRRYVLTNMVAGSGATSFAPIWFDYDTSRPPTCGKDCKHSMLAAVSFGASVVTPPPSDATLAKAMPMPGGGLPRRRIMGDTLYALGERHCGFALYETDDLRDDRLPFPFDRARIFRREAAAGADALTVECSVQNGGGACRTAIEYELGAHLWMAFPLPLLCETDEVLRRTRKIFSDRLIARTEPVPGWGKVNN